MVEGIGAGDASPAGLDALALRLFGWLMLFGGGLLLLALAGLLQLPHGSSLGLPGYAVPGTRGQHAFMPAVVPILAGSGGGLAALGLVLLWFAQRSPTRRVPRLRRARGRRPVLILLAGLTVLVLVLLRR